MSEWLSRWSMESFHPTSCVVVGTVAAATLLLIARAIRRRHTTTSRLCVAAGLTVAISMLSLVPPVRRWGVDQALRHIGPGEAVTQPPPADVAVQFDLPDAAASTSPPMAPAPPALPTTLVAFETQPVATSEPLVSSRVPLEKVHVVRPSVASSMEELLAALDDWEEPTPEPQPQIQSAEPAVVAEVEPAPERPQPVVATIPRAWTPGSAIQPEPEPVAVMADSRSGNAKAAALTEGGGDASTEAAVAAGLKFIAAAQSPSGMWDPRQTGGGRERAPLGLRRGTAGQNADTGITGLAVLAMLGAGQTHHAGEHRQCIYDALVALVARQKPDGSLAAGASIYAAHYCHAMASLAMAEAAWMTGDAVAIDATRRAVGYTIATQHPRTGGWRYTAGDPGDLSQTGWQVMMLHTASQIDGVRVPPQSMTAARHFVRSVAIGRSGGLAAYRPGERPSRTMTGEALAIRLLTGDRPSHQAIAEATTSLLAAPPGSHGPDNLYGWYYTTIALHQLGGEPWRRWNAALKKHLLSTQNGDGSWPASGLWGGYGGRIYSTAVATLCLESYYRH